MRKTLLTAVAGAALVLGGVGAHADTLDNIKQRGQVICGVNTGLPGFAAPNEKGEWTGLDVDYCRAIAAAVLGDATKAKFVPVSTKDRFTALQSGEIDVLNRNSTWTLGRDTAGMLFAGVNFYDGQGFLVKKSLGVKSATELSGASICAQQGSTGQLTISDYMRTHNLPYNIVSFDTPEEAARAYEGGRCDVNTDDASGLYAVRVKMANPDDHVVLPEIISKEPLAAAVRQGDDKWYNVVKWVHYAMLTAEEAGVTQANVDEMVKSDKPDIKRLLGTEGDFGKQLGLDNQWAYRIVKQVGNYGESFDRNLGPKTVLKIDRGLNNLWSKGGLQYAPPIR